MKEVILSADGDSIVYSVPDEVANDLRKYCIEFCDKWMKKSPHAKCFRTKQGYCYNEADFIDYLNKFVFPEQKIYYGRKSWLDGFGRKSASRI